MPSGFRRFTRGREIERLAVAAHQIGNAHQFVQWGDALRDVKQFDAAASAYASALAKEDDNRQALWGAGLVDFELKRYETARERLKKLLDIDAQYKFGDVSLVYGRALYELNQRDAANEHLQKHVKRWRHPEAFFVLAQIAADSGDVPAARSHLQTMLLDINGCPRAIARRHATWKSKAARLLKKLPPP
jgi:tetratricopeptide (TPR) repeat protein